MQKLLFLALIIVAATAIHWFSQNQGGITLNWLGYEIHTSMAVMLLAMVATLVILSITWRLVATLFDLPSSFRRGQQNRHYQKGLEALTQAMISGASEGDMNQARHYLNQAQKHLPNSPLPQLMHYRLDKRDGHGKAALEMQQRRLTQLEGHTSTRALALQELALLARDQGNMAEALRQSQAHAKLAPRDKQACLLTAELLAYHQRWQEAERDLKRAKQFGHLSREEWHHKQAVLLTHQAQQMIADEKRRSALPVLEKALKYQPDLLPAALDYAQMQHQLGQERKASAALKQLWKRSPHPKAAELYQSFWSALKPEKQMKKAEELAKLNPNAYESAMLIARLAVTQQDWETARSRLKAAMQHQITVEACRLMAEICRRSEQDAEREKHWLEKAVTAAHSAQWHCTHCHHITPKWQAFCDKCTRFATLNWQPATPITRRERASAEPILIH